jgi:hypothetical protein
MVNQKDEQIAMESMLGQRKLTTGEIQKHFDGFGLEPQVCICIKTPSLCTTYVLKTPLYVLHMY